MGWILKHKFELLIFLGITILYFLLRIPNLTLQPIFADEAIYIRWAQVMRAEPTLRFLPLSDGKTPLFMWAMIPFLKIFSDPLFAGRILSILGGFMTILGGFLLGWKFFNLKTGLWAAFLLTITPYIVFFDRMALVDSTFSALSLWSLFLALLLIKYMRIDLAMVLGFTLGASILTKTPGIFNTLTLPTTLIAFDWSRHKRSQRMLKILGLWIISIIISQVMYNALRLGPNFDSLSSRNQDYVHSPERLLQYPLDPFLPHYRDMRDWFPKLLTVPVLLVMFGGIVLAFLKRNRTALTMVAWSILPLIILMALLKTFTARYVLFPIPPLIVLGGWFIAYSIDNLKFDKRLTTIAAIVLVSIPALSFNFKLLNDPETAPLPKTERVGYFEDWTAGYGLKEIASYLEEESKKGPIVVGTEGFFGTLPDGLFIYLDKTPNVSIVGGKAQVSQDIRNAALEKPTFFVANKSRTLSVPEGLVLIKEFPKAVGSTNPPDAMLLFKVNPINKVDSSGEEIKVSE